MAHKFANVLIHYVFGTKERRNLIPADLQPRLWKYIGGIGARKGIPVLTVGGTGNHAHLLIALPTDVSVAKAVQVIKANSSRWVGEHGIEFTWQEGYGAFSVSPSNVAARFADTSTTNPNTTQNDHLKTNSWTCCGNRALRSIRMTCLCSVPSPI